MILSIIVAAAENNVIGRQGTLPWNLPAEMAYFRRTTSGHPVIMGRKTHEEIGRALPNRLNVVISSDPNYPAAEGCVVVDSIEKALSLSEVKTANEVFVIGGESINKLALPLADKIYLTRVHAKVEGDRYFEYPPEKWKLAWSEKHPADEQNKYAFELMVLERKR